MDTPPPGGAHSRLIPPRRAFPGSAAAAPGTGVPEVSAPEAHPDQGDVGREPASGDRGPGRRGSRDRGPFPELDEPPSAGLGDSARGAPGEGPGNPADRPIYAWNPSDTTEAFPKVVPPEDSR
jgi:hypothetical protein